MTNNPSRAARMAARDRGVRTVRRVSVAVAVSAAAAIAGVTGVLSAAWTDAAAPSSESSSLAQANTDTGSTAGSDDWGTSTTPQSSSGGSNHTATGGS